MRAEEEAEIRRLAAAVLAGHEEEWPALFHQLERAILPLVSKYLRTKQPADREDVFQEAMADIAVKNVAQLSPSGVRSIPGWVHFRVVQQARMFHRRARRVARSFPINDAGLWQSIDKGDFVQEFEARELVCEAESSLPAEMVQLIELRLAGFKPAQIRSKLSLSLDQYRARLKAIRAHFSGLRMQQHPVYPPQT